MAINEYLVEVFKDAKQEVLKQIDSFDRYTILKVATGGLVGATIVYGM